MGVGDAPTLEIGLQFVWFVAKEKEKTIGNESGSKLVSKVKTMEPPPPRLTARILTRHLDWSPLTSNGCKTPGK